MSGQNHDTDSAASSSQPLIDESLRADPLARGLERLRIRPSVFGLILLAFGLVHTLLLPAIFGYLNTSDSGGGVVLGALDDWPALVVELVMVPVIAGYYVWQPGTMQAVYYGLAGRLSRGPELVARAAELTRMLGWPGWGPLAFAVGLLEAGYALLIYQGYAIVTWETANPAMLVSLLLIRFLTFYCLVFIVVRQVLMIIGLNRVFLEFAVEIAPLHPDKAGGLRMLGDYVLTTGLIIAAIGLNFGMGLLRLRLNPDVLTAEFYVSMALYFVLSPLVFFMPLIQVHRQMRNAKSRLLAEVAEQFDLEYRKLLDGLRRNELEAGGVPRLEAIQKIYQITDGASVWPFDLGIASKFTAAALLPVLLPFVVELVSRSVMR
jgi:hypothetical protein